MTFVETICGENWNTVSEEDKNAGLGVACMQAYINGVKPIIDELSSFLNVNKEEIRLPFQRLLQSGVFSKAYNARGDKWLNLNLGKTNNISEIRCAWSYIAGISGAFVTRNYSNMDIKVRE